VKTLLLVLLSCSCFGADVRNHLVVVQHSTVHWSFPPGIQQIEGNGICINRGCSIVATAYHIQMLVGRPDLGINGSRTEKVLSLANDEDTGKTELATEISGLGKKTLSFNPTRDVSFIYTTGASHHKLGIPYSYKSHVGQPVQIAGYRKGRLVTSTARIIGLDVPLAMGQSRLNENLVLDIAMAPGMSGSAVIDERGNLLGMVTLSGAIKNGSGDRVASVALPTKTIAKALLKLDPESAKSIFLDIPLDVPEEEAIAPALSDFYEESDLSEDGASLIPSFATVSGEVPDAVGKLRARSDATSKMAINLVTKQCLGQGTRKPLCHELAIVEGEQTFRKIASDGRLGAQTNSFPKQKHGVWTESDWADTMGEIADNSWTFQGSVDGHYLFTASSTAESERCYWEEYSTAVPLFGGGHGDWKGAVDCDEWVVTDFDFNVLSSFALMYPPASCAARLVETAMQYDWITLPGAKVPVLLPVTEQVTAKMSGQKKVLTASVVWSDYREFRAEHKLRF
jgi:hypothetical protein